MSQCSLALVIDVGQRTFTDQVYTDVQGAEQALNHQHLRLT